MIPKKGEFVKRARAWGAYQFGGKAEAVHKFYHEYTNGKTTDPPFPPIRVFVSPFVDGFLYRLIRALALSLPQK